MSFVPFRDELFLRMGTKASKSVPSSWFSPHYQAGVSQRPKSVHFSTTIYTKRVSI